MKKIAIIIILSFVSINTFSQVATFSDKKIEIKNVVLKTKIFDYIKYVKDWAASKKDVRNYMITLDQQTLGENTIFTLRTILFSISINSFSPSAYTIIDETPVLLHSGVESFVEKNQDFFIFLKKTYWKNLPDTEVKANIDKQMKAFENENKDLPDSVMMYDSAGYRVPKSGIRPNIIPIETHQSPPKSWTLYFKGQDLKRETEDRYNMIQQ